VVDVLGEADLVLDWDELQQSSIMRFLRSRDEEGNLCRHAL